MTKENQILFDYRDKYLRRHYPEAEKNDIPDEIRLLLLQTKPGSDEIKFLKGDIGDKATDKEFQEYLYELSVGLQYSNDKLGVIPAEITSVSPDTLGDQPFAFDMSRGIFGINDTHIYENIRNKRNGGESVMMLYNSPMQFSPSEDTILLGVESGFNYLEALGKQHTEPKLDFINQAIKDLGLGRSAEKDPSLV